MRHWDDEKDRRVTQLRKGILELAVMGALYHEPHYGYSLVRALTQDGSISLKEGTVYPILARLHRDNLVRSEWVESVQGPPRRYYTLTAAGRQLYTELREDFDLLISLVEQDWGIRERPESTGRKVVIRKR